MEYDARTRNQMIIAICSIFNSEVLACMSFLYLNVYQVMNLSLLTFIIGFSSFFKQSGALV